MAKNVTQDENKMSREVPGVSYKQKIQDLRKAIEKVQIQKRKSTEKQKRLLEKLEEVSKKNSDKTH